MNVKELKELLAQIEDETLEVRIHQVIEPMDVDAENYWVNGIAVHPTGESGYEEEGEVVIIGVE